MSATDTIHRERLLMVRAAANALSVRHKSGAKPIDYLKAFLPIARQLGYATQDDSWGEFEKEFSIIVSVLIDYMLGERTPETKP